MKFENIKVYNFENALRGMRNPKNSWHLSDSKFGIGLWEFCMDDCYDVAYNWAMKDRENDIDIERELNNYSEWLSNNGILYDDDCCEWAFIGPKDMKLAQTLIKGGSEHRKFLR